MSPSLSTMCVACKPVPHMMVDHHFNGFNDTHATKHTNGSKAGRGEHGHGVCSHSNPQRAQLLWEDEEPPELCQCPGFKAPEE